MAAKHWMGLVLAACSMQAYAAQDPQLAKVLTQMDAAAAKFTTAQADFSCDQYTAVVQDHDIQKGTIAFHRSNASMVTVVHVQTENSQNAPKDVLYREGQLELFQPQINQETILAATGKQGQFESYASLGFGGSSKELLANWNVKYDGPDTVDGTKVVKLELVPKNPGPSPMFARIEIWLDPVTDTSRKQIFYTPGGDTRTTLYTNIKLGNVPDSTFKLKIPKGTQVIHK